MEVVYQGIVVRANANNGDEVVDFSFSVFDAGLASAVDQSFTGGQTSAKETLFYCWKRRFISPGEGWIETLPQ